MIWLARTEGVPDHIQAINPVHILKIHTTLKAFLDAKRKAAVLLDGLEYLIVQNDFISVMLIPVNPDALEQKQLGILERDCVRMNIP